MNQVEPKEEFCVGSPQVLSRLTRGQEANPLGLIVEGVIKPVRNQSGLANMSSHVKEKVMKNNEILKETVF